MADESTTLDKRLVVCPLSEGLGYVQNYRVTERPNRGCYESRPVKGTDKWADDFFRVLHAPRGETVEVTLSNGETGTLRGLGKPEAQALKFSHKAGLKARERVVKRVNEGEIRAPKKNWDANFGPERIITHEGDSFQLGGGMPIDELKKKYPDMYGAATRRSTAKSDEDESVIDDDALAQLDNDVELSASDEADMKAREEARESEPAEGLAEPLNTDDIEAVADEIGEGEGAYTTDEPEESYAVEEALMEPQDEVMDDFDEPETKPAAKKPIKQTDSVDEHSLVIKAPKSATAVKTNAIKFMDGDEEITMYKIKHPITDDSVWVREGVNELDGAVLHVTVRSSK